MHVTQGVVHRDLKSDNILFQSPDDLEIKIADLGLADYIWDKETKGGRTTFSDYCGTLRFMAPEIINNEEYDNKVDVWSIGIITYQLLRGMCPFTSQDEKILEEKILNDSVEGRMKYIDHISPQCKDFIYRTLERDQNKRWTCE